MKINYITSKKLAFFQHQIKHFLSIKNQTNKRYLAVQSAPFDTQINIFYKKLKNRPFFMNYVFRMILSPTRKGLKSMQSINWSSGDNSWTSSLSRTRSEFCFSRKLNLVFVEIRLNIPNVGKTWNSNLKLGAWSHPCKM